MKEIEFQKRVIELLESIAGACARAESWAPHVPDELPSPLSDSVAPPALVGPQFPRGKGGRKAKRA